MFFVLILLFTITIQAHPGRTDSNGGHYNHSTGGYHYHHGYSAHNHYDIDGDGKLDCPYEFNDKTNQGNSSNNTSKDIVAAIFSIIGISILALFIGYFSFMLKLFQTLIMIPIEALIKKHCKEELQDKMYDRFSIVVMVFLCVSVVALVTVIHILQI